MKIINLGRGQGKTTRLLYASEFNDMPINYMKKELLERAAFCGLDIPEPIAVNDIISNKHRDSEVVDKEILVDEAPMVLQNLLNQLGMHSAIKAITLTEKQ